ncbi:MAG: hypothetical protein J6W11_05890 [Alphaproteobacteria bacterium]|nr:hypothetical protein [Alphaproteobacteria bacterium]
MKKSERENLQTYQNISELFYDLTNQLKTCHFEFCAYVVEEAYYLYSIELEKRLHSNIN